MPKFLIQASYTPEGFKGLLKDKGSGRKAAVSQALEALGGKLEGMYFSFGDQDVVLIADLPDSATAAAMAMAACGSGMVRTRTTPLFTAEECDKVIAKGVSYRAPGT